jgi:hypothetical protein
MMRRFTARDGRTWDIVIGRASWGAVYAIFAPAAGSDAAVRQTLLSAVSVEAAQDELYALGPDALQALLDRSEPKTD